MTDTNTDTSGGQSSTGQSTETNTTDGQGAGAGAGAGEAKSWLEQLPEALRGNQNLTKYEDLGAFANAHLHALQRFGKDPASLVEVPTKPDDEKGWGDLFNKLGRPETADGYKLELGEGATDADKAFVDGFKGIAHKAGLTQSQMGAAIGYLNEVTAAATKAANDAAEAAKAECVKVLGAAWGDKKGIYEAEIPKLLTELGEQLKIPDVFDKLNAQGLGNSPELLRILAAVTDMRGEPGKLPGAGEGGAVAPATPYQAMQALAALHADPVKSKALLEKTDPLHKAVLAEREALLKQAYPNQPAG